MNHSAQITIEEILRGQFGTGAERRDRGMQSVLSNAPEEYRNKFLALVRGLPHGLTFTGEKIRELAGDPPRESHHNCMGALMRTAALRGLIRKTGTTVKAERPSRHSADIALWIRL